MRVIRRNFDLFCLENGIIFDDKNCSKIINSLILGITNIDDEDSIPVSFDKLSKLFESTFEIACSSFMEVIELIKEEEVEFWNFSKYCGAVSNDSGIRNDTIHKVKGLEFDVVILNGINENKLPRQKLLDASNWTYKDLTEDDINKARTVFYVACSRPRKKLIINHNWKPSMFIDLIKQ
jgi:DNA helicase-2/ATP-dependent DNA helicase PcrA